jgi:hypothetical protein
VVFVLNDLQVILVLVALLCVLMGAQAFIDA